MFKKRDLDFLAIAGGSKGELKNRHVNKIILLQGKDSEEDVLYLGKIVKKGDRVGFDTFPLHYEEYKELIKKAKRDMKFPKGVKIENIETPESFRLLFTESLVCQKRK